MNLPRIEIKQCAYFITTKVKNGERFFKSERIGNIFIKILNNLQKELKFKIYTWVLMPNHYHLLIGLPENLNLSSLMHRLNGSSANIINKILNRSGNLWQGGYWDKGIYTEKFFKEKFNYIHKNSLKWELVKNAEDYQFSSAKDYFRKYRSCYFT